MKKQKKVMLKSFCCCATSASGHYCGIASSSVKLNSQIKTTSASTVKTTTTNPSDKTLPPKLKRKPKENKNVCMISTDVYESTQMKTVQQNVEYFSNFHHSTPIDAVNKKSTRVSSANVDSCMSYSSSSSQNDHSPATNSIHFYHPKSRM